MGKFKNAVRDFFHKPYTDNRGYEHRYRPDSYSADSKGYVPTHRAVAEEKIGGAIRKNRVVHHIDYDKTNNKPNNLRVMPKKQHDALPGHYNDQKKKYK